MLLLRRLAESLALNAGMLAMMVLVMGLGLGEKMAERFLPVYLMALGATPLWVGGLNALNNLLNALYAFPGGALSDRLGYKKALIVFTLLAMFGYLLVILIPRWQAVFAGSVFFISWTAISLPAIMSLVSKRVKANKRTTGVTVHSFVRRIPMALGPILGGWAIARYGEVPGIRIAFGIAFVMCCAFSTSSDESGRHNRP
ncbi:MAG: MFS transporter [Lentisphaerae bacterium]|nr:MFS transporter [Lentisphaerota bacterium]